MLVDKTDTMKQEYLNVNEYYASFDLALCTALSLYFPLEAIDRTQDSHKAQFLFKRSQELNTFLERYWRGEIRIEPQAFFNQLKSIKARLYSERTA